MKVESYVKEAEKQARYLAKLGITSVWFPPAYKGTNGGYSTGYDAYDLMTWRI
jgi:alpha-amylase